MDSKIPTNLSKVIEDFQFCEGREKIELLIQFSEDLPPLPDWVSSDHSTMNQVHECMTPVFIQVEKSETGLVFHFDVPAQSPTVRGFASIMKKGLDGSTPEEILQIPNDFYLELGLQNLLTHQRLNGLSAILAHMKQLSVQNM